MKLREYYDRYLPKFARKPLLALFIYNCIVFWLSRPLVAGKYHYDMSLPFEVKIPFLTWTMLIYVAAFVFWAVNYIMSSWQGKEAFRRFFWSEIAAKTVCFLCFVLIPTTMVRPEVTGNSVFDLLTKLIYLSDSPDNLFPSIHCLASWFCFIAVRKNEKVPGWYKRFSCVFMILVCISTLTVKQHVFWDTVSGVVLAEVCYQAVGLFMKKKEA